MSATRSTARLTTGARLALFLLLSGCGGCPVVDDGRVWVEPIDVPLGTMYFCPYWAMHDLSRSCNSRVDAPCGYAELGLPAVKLEAVRWSDVEKKAPSGDEHSYDWSTLDEAVLRWEEAGATRLQFHLEPESSWGTQDSRSIAEDLFGLDCASIDSACEGLPANPKPEHWDDWEAWVGALCERYDGDGVDDVEGLSYAHLDFELLNEGQNWQFYMGSSEHYLELLEHTRAALDACHDDARIIHYGVTFNGLMHGGASDELYWERAAEKVAALEPVLYGPGYRHAHDMMLGSPDPAASHDVQPTLGMCEHFEVVDLHCNMSIEHMIEEHDFLRAKLDGWGCEHVEILCGDATSAPALYSPSELEWWDSSYGGADSSGEKLHLALAEPWSTYGLLCNPDGLEPALTYDVAEVWYDSRHAAFLVKKASTALGLGMSGFMAGLLEDWPPASGCYWMYQGLTESPVEGLGLVPVDYGEPREAYRSFRRLAEAIEGYPHASRAVVDGVTIITFTSDDPERLPKHVVWYLDDHLPLPGEVQATGLYEIEVHGTRTTATSLLDDGSMRIANGGGTFTDAVGQDPVLVEEWAE
jgi:hypothetical protein